MPDKIPDFVINGENRPPSRREVERSGGSGPGANTRSHGAVVVRACAIPSKWFFEAATGLDRLDFTSATARFATSETGFELGNGDYLIAVCGCTAPSSAYILTAFMRIRNGICTSRAIQHTNSPGSQAPATAGNQNHRWFRLKEAFPLGLLSFTSSRSLGLHEHERLPCGEQIHLRIVE